MKRGVYSVLQMPLDENEAIDPTPLAREIDWLIELGVSGFSIAMVSEIMRFSSDERRSQWQLVIKLIDGRLPLIVSIGAESTAVAVRQAKFAEADGATLLMATPPASFPATSEEIFHYYRSIFDAVQIPIIVQDASNYMGQPLPIELYERLLHDFGSSRVQFKPEAVPVAERVAAIQRAANGQALVFEGQSGMDLLDTHPLGLFGTMPGSEIVWAIKPLWEALEVGDTDRASLIHQGISKLIKFQTTIDAYVAVEKYLLVKQGIFTSVKQRGPVNTVLTADTKLAIDQAYEGLIHIVAG
jgi:2-keto-3-deoxy-L-arabinonate dehydratase